MARSSCKTQRNSRSRSPSWMHPRASLSGNGSRPSHPSRGTEMSEADHNGPSRRDFIKATTGIVGSLIGLVLGIPAIGYLIGPALQKGDASAWEDLGELSKSPLNVPSLFQFTRTEVNGWERTGMTYGVFVVRQSDTSVRV